MSRRVVQHHLNALHLMAWAVRIGLRRETALGLARWWERCLHPLLYPAARGRRSLRTRDSARVPLRSSIFR